MGVAAGGGRGGPVMLSIIKGRLKGRSRGRGICGHDRGGGFVTFSGRNCPGVRGRIMTAD